MKTKIALIMAGGTGGHIFPGLALAEALRERGWTVHWLGAPGTVDSPSMESQLVPPRGFIFEPIDFSGVRGKNPLTFALLPLRLLKAFLQSIVVMNRVKPDVVIGLGGYITFPGGMMGVLCGKPLVLHEQNSVAGLANKVLASVADRVFTAFPDVLKGSRRVQWIGNPLREEFLQHPEPAERFAGRTGPLRVTVIGGSLGARALNEIVPAALARLPAAQRPLVLHQGGAKQIGELRANYEKAGVEAELTPFIKDTSSAFAEADFVICRAGASTVTEIAAVGAAALFVPFPFAVDDHQTTNARFLSDANAAWMIPQAELSADRLAQMFISLTREQLIARAEAAKLRAKTSATREIVLACEEIAS